jgi:hypothetical protein
MEHGTHPHSVVLEIITAIAAIAVVLYLIFGPLN